MVDSVIQFNWTRTNWVKTTAQLISTPMGARGAQNWWVIYANGKSDIIRCKAKLVIRSIIQRQSTLDLERILLVSSSPLLDVLYCHCRDQTRQTVFKTWVINCRDSRTVRHAFVTNSNYIMHISILLNDLGWQHIETQRQIQKAGWRINLWIDLHLITCLQNSYYVAICLILITLETPKISLLFSCHEPVAIEIASAIAGLFCGKICPLM